MSSPIVLKTGPVLTGSLGLCEDGYIRLDCKALLDTELIHLVSGLDDAPTGGLKCGTGVAAISGFTEWISTARPILSVGWDWVIGSRDGRAHYVMSGKPRSNIMLVDDQCRDLGFEATADLLIARLERLIWQDATNAAITSRYA
ncbi:DUF4902 domain-containing protein [Silvimonas iriomotensis]|uniref:DUF4902 domain-containing protein n=1 Tax=Silvimonas iriomotensis TaxID=449662 RepID=A0ABQ2P7X4_9NEIS|nr:DUF4902 domain-containing protein [Silvimonas iriomotensis]GGP19859.1 DUF4902 domain-containing protein [Silvimonas iriomotensis]